MVVIRGSGVNFDRRSDAAQPETEAEPLEVICYEMQ